MPTKKTPRFGLLNYGIGTTASKKLVIFGGVLESSFKTQRLRTFTNLRELWIINLLKKDSDFNQISWSISQGGFSKIVSLSGETLCIINPNFETQLILIDIQKLISYPIRSISLPQNIKRIGFGIAPINSTDFLILGGYNLFENSEVHALGPINILTQVSFHEMSEDISFAMLNTESIVIISIVFLLVFAISFTYRKYRNASIYQYKSKLINLKEFNEITNENNKDLESEDINT